MSNKRLQESLFDKLEGSRWSGNERYFACWCPFDTHHKPALLVFNDGYTCLSCGTSGDLEYLNRFLSKGTINVLQKRSTVLKPILPKWSSWQRRYETLEGIADAAHRIADNGMRGYFQKRKIDQFFEQGFFGRLDGWYLFPVFNREHEIVDIVVRAGNGKKDKGAKYVVSSMNDGERPLYVPNWERVIRSDVLYIVFGIITAWSMEAIGLPCATGITGKSLNPELLRDFHKQIIVIPDYDEDNAGVKLVNGLGWRGKLKLVDFPSSCSDLDDVRVQFGNNALLNLIGV